MEVWWSGVGLD